MRRVFVDSSAWLSLVSRTDDRHAAVRAAITTPATRAVTTNHIIDETITLCLARLGHATAVAVGRRIRDPKCVDIVRVSARDEDAAFELFRNRPDKTYSFTDCTSFVVMRRLGIDSAVTLDGDFRREGFTVLPGNADSP